MNIFEEEKLFDYGIYCLIDSMCIWMEYIPDVTEKDINDIIAGQYNEKAKTRNEATKQLYELRQEAKAINKLSG